MTDMERVFITRDGMDLSEAKRKRNELRKEMHELLSEGADYDDIEEMLWAEELEMDYIFDLM